MRSLLLTLLMLFYAGNAFAIDPQEQPKIDALLRQLEEANIVLIRNDMKMSGKQAADHFRDKLRSRENVLHTALDFIDVIATKSWQSGKAYVIILPNGELEPSAKWFTVRLKAIEAAPPAPAKPAEITQPCSSEPAPQQESSSQP